MTCTKRNLGTAEKDCTELLQVTSHEKVVIEHNQWSAHSGQSGWLISVSVPGSYQKAKTKKTENRPSGRTDVTSENVFNGCKSLQPKPFQNMNKEDGTLKLDSIAWFSWKRISGQDYVTNSTDMCSMQPGMLWRWQTSVTMAFCLRDVRASPARLTTAFTNMRVLEKLFEWKIQNLVTEIAYKRAAFVMTWSLFR